MPAYNSQYTGLQVDAALTAVYTAMGNNGIVDNDALTTALGSYLLSSTAANTYLTKTDAVNIYQPAIITGTTGQFYRGDKSWSNVLNGRFRVTNANGTRGDIEAYRGDITVWLGIGTGNNNHGVYSEKKGDWIVYSDASGNVTLNGNAATATALGSSGYGVTCLTWVQTSGSWDGNSGWCHYLINNHGDGASYYHYTLGFPFSGPMIYRRQNGNTSLVSSWYTIYSTENMSSSRWIKENITPVSDNEAKKLLKLDVVHFDYKEGYCQGAKNQVGLIAEDVEEIIPQIIHINQNLDSEGNQIDTEESPTIKSILYDKLIPYCIRMIQIQEEEIKMLQLRITNLEGR